jgi:hypothetical protein
MIFLPVSLRFCFPGVPSYRLDRETLYGYCASDAKAKRKEHGAREAKR